MSAQLEELKAFKARKDFFIGIDSDGCAFDSMELKHKECFCPETIYNWGLQPVSRFAREVWDFVNLYSPSRGVNRFIALRDFLKLLAQRSDVQKRGFKVPEIKALEQWISKESRLGEAVLIEYAKANPDPVLDRAIEWSRCINASVARIASDIRPFPGVREALAKMHEAADVMVVSQTPVGTLAREWKHNKMDCYIGLIAGQEAGTKTEHIKYGAGGKYNAGHVLMIGDAPGDRDAALANGALFYPIVPGREDYFWARFISEALGKFLGGSFDKTYQGMLLEEFARSLPKNPPWEK